MEKFWLKIRKTEIHAAVDLVFQCSVDLLNHNTTMWNKHIYKLHLYEKNYRITQSVHKLQCIICTKFSQPILEGMRQESTPPQAHKL